MLLDIRRPNSNVKSPERTNLINVVEESFMNENESCEIMNDSSDDRSLALQKMPTPMKVSCCPHQEVMEDKTPSSLT